MLNKLINICEIIRCKNIISPGGLETIIKKPIVYKEFNITIFPCSYKNKIKIDIELNTYNNFYFMPRNHKIEMRLWIIREEVLNNIPKYVANPNDLYINIRSGDIFINKINCKYSQPPLCFYQSIINKNNFNNIFILSNGHENPVVDELLKLYNTIKYIHGSVEHDISVVINAFNFVMPVSTFSFNLIVLNNNLKNLYIYDLFDFYLKNGNYTVHKMKPSPKYMKMMKTNWKNTKEQLNLMIKENCINSNMSSFTKSI